MFVIYMIPLNFYMHFLVSLVLFNTRFWNSGKRFSKIRNCKRYLSAI